MSYALGPAATTDAYPSPGGGGLAVEVQECERVTIIVANNPVIYSLRLPANLDSQTPWGSDHYLPAAAGVAWAFSFDRKCAGIRFKSAVAGQPGTVICQLIPSSELP